MKQLSMGAPGEVSRRERDLGRNTDLCEVLRQNQAPIFRAAPGKEGAGGRENIIFGNQVFWQGWRVPLGI